MPSSSLLLSCPGLLIAQRRLPSGASSGHPAVRHRRRARPCQDASHGVGRRSASSMRCPPIRFRRPGPAVRPVRCPVTWVRRPAVWCPAVWCPPNPVSSRLLSAPVRPDASVWSPSGGAVWGQADAARQPAPREWVQVLWLPRRRAARVDGRAGPDAGDAAEVTHGRRGCRWRTRAGSVGAASAIDAGLPGRPGRRAGRRSPAAARGHGGGRSARLPYRPRDCRP
jgi:hypothetical protein